MSPLLQPPASRHGLVVGLAGRHPLDRLVARQAHAGGARLVLACTAGPGCGEGLLGLADELDAPLLQGDLARPGALQAMVNSACTQLQGQLDFVVHTMAWAPLADDDGLLTERSADEYLLAMRQTCHAFAELTHWCARHMDHGGALVALSAHACDAALRRHGLAGAVQAALDSMVRYLAAELAPHGIQVLSHAVDEGDLSAQAAALWQRLSGPRPAAHPSPLADAAPPGPSAPPALAPATADDTGLDPPRQDAARSS